MAAPKLYISYSWSNPEHEQWVLDLAVELRESGVDVILDKWDLKEGHDAVAFMEQMVTNPDIKKVAIICDAVYAAKADVRSGGVGTETQIISTGVYENQSQEKFVAVIREKDVNGKPFLPTYYKSRIYIDLSESDRYSEQFERLLRWIFDRPLFIKPEIGNEPSFLAEGDHLSLGTTAIFKRCLDGLKNQKNHAAGTFYEYSSTFASNLESFRLSKPEGDYDDALIKNIKEFIPYRNEAIQLFNAIAQYSPTPEFMQQIHRLFESFIPYIQTPMSILGGSEWDLDNFKFLIHELFLYALAIFIKHDRLEQAKDILAQPYYWQGDSEYSNDLMISYIVFRQYLKSLDHRNKRLNLRCLSLRADLLKERTNGTGIAFRYLMQADFVGFMRSEVENTRWWPETLLYIHRSNSPFEIFARSVSKAYFDRAKALLAIDSPEDLQPLLMSYQNGSRKLPTWDYLGLNPAALLGYDKLATRS